MIILIISLVLYETHVVFFGLVGNLVRAHSWTNDLCTLNSARLTQCLLLSECILIMIGLDLTVVVRCTKCQSFQNGQKFKSRVQ